MTDIPRSELTKEAMGGTELLLMRLFESIPEDLMKEFQIIPTRLTEPLDQTKIRILWIHDLADDPQLHYLRNEGWRKFHLIVFVSNWQMQTFISAYKIPWERCLVIQNAIQPIMNIEKPSDKVNLIYTPTPHRGLEILVPIFQKLAAEYPDKLHLDVYSSFKLYGWGKRDEAYRSLFDVCEADPNITYHGTKSNNEIRAALGKAHIFAYPSIWTETSSLCLIEAMSAGCLCVHSNLGALFETAANFTYMYQFSADVNHHATTFYNVLKIAINHVLAGDVVKQRLQHQKMYTDQVYNWDMRAQQWKSLMESLLNLPRQIESHETHFIYEAGR